MKNYKFFKFILILISIFSLLFANLIKVNAKEKESSLNKNSFFNEEKIISNLPLPLENLMSIINKIRITNPQIKINPLNLDISQKDNISDFFLNFNYQKVLKDIENWFEINTGIDIISIFKTILGIVIWFWEIIINLLKLLLSKI